MALLVWVENFRGTLWPDRYIYKQGYKALAQDREKLIKENFEILETLKFEEFLETYKIARRRFEILESFRNFKKFLDFRKSLNFRKF